MSQLDQTEARDLLAKWMAHHIAELIDRAESATDGERDRCNAECCTAILDFWSRRRHLWEGVRPAVELEPVLRALQTLDVHKDTWRYIRHDHTRGREKEETPADRWLRVAEGVDYTARLLIRHCLAAAAENSIEGSKLWVELAEAAGVSAEPHVQLVRFIIAENEVTAGVYNEKARKEAEERVSRLDAFLKEATVLAGDLRARLGAVDGTENE